MRTMMGILLTTVIISAAETAHDRPSENSIKSNQLPLPLCVKDAADIQNIISITKKNTDTHRKYDGYRKALASDSDQELTARLIYAETIAANCPQQQILVLPLIAGAINNRIHLRKGKVKSVVFERNQFASSLNHYSSSKYLDFLCPTNLKLWTHAMECSEKKNEALSPKAVNYYLYKHHPGWDKEPWSLPETSLSLNSQTRECIRVFEDKSWK